MILPSAVISGLSRKRCAGQQNQQQQRQSQRKLAFAGTEQQKKKEQRTNKQLDDFPALGLMAELFGGRVRKEETRIFPAQRFDPQCHIGVWLCEYPIRVLDGRSPGSNRNSPPASHIPTMKQAILRECMMNT